MLSDLYEALNVPIMQVCLHSIDEHSSTIHINWNSNVKRPVRSIKCVSNASMSTISLTNIPVQYI